MSLRFALSPFSAGGGRWFVLAVLASLHRGAGNRRIGVMDGTNRCLLAEYKKKERQNSTTMTRLRRRQPSETTPQKKGFMFRRTGASYGRSPEIEGSPVSKLRVFLGEDAAWSGGRLGESPLGLFDCTAATGVPQITNASPEAALSCRLRS